MTSGLESNLYGSSVQIWCVLRDRHYNHSTLVREIDPQNLTLGKLFTAKAPRRGDAKEDLDLFPVLQVTDLFGSRPNHYLPGKLSLASLRLGVDRFAT